MMNPRYFVRMLRICWSRAPPTSSAQKKTKGSPGGNPYAIPWRQETETRFPPHCLFSPVHSQFPAATGTTTREVDTKWQGRTKKLPGRLSRRHKSPCRRRSAYQRALSVNALRVIFLRNRIRPNAFSKAKCPFRIPEGDRMDNPVVWVILATIAWWAYKSGKRTVSRKVYNAGRRHSYRRYRRW